jgi:transposase-like protein
MAKREKKEKDQWDQVLDQIDFKGLTQEEVLGQDGLVKQLTRRLLQRVLEAEMDGHLGYQKHDNSGDNSGDSRNGYSEKTVLTENQEMTLQIPRDRNGTFEPQILPKYQKRVPLFNDQVISMYSLGMTDRDIRNHIKKIYNVDVSPELISNITDAGKRGGEGMAEPTAGKQLCDRVSGCAAGEKQAGGKKLRKERICGVRG